MHHTGERPRYDTCIGFTVHEEVGHGGSTLPQVDELLAVDMGCIGEDLSCTEYQVSICAKDSNGPYDYGMVSRLVKLATDNGVDCAVDIYPHYGSDVAAAWEAGMDARARPDRAGSARLARHGAHPYGRIAGHAQAGGIVSAAGVTAQAPPNIEISGAFRGICLSKGPGYRSGAAFRAGSGLIQWPELRAEYAYHLLCEPVRGRDLARRSALAVCRLGRR